MNISVKHIGLESTPTLDKYVDTKVKSLEKLVKSLEIDAEAELFLELSRTTRHHHKGNVFLASAKLVLPGKTFRGSEQSDDIRTALDALKDMLKMDLERYKERVVSGVRQKKTAKK